MAFFMTAVYGILGMGLGTVLFLKMPDAGRKRLVRDIACRGIPP